jgi:hypothetical protein
MKVSAMAVRIKDVRDGADVKDGIRLGQGVVAGVVAERAFVAQRLARVNVAFDVPRLRDGVGQNGFQARAKSFQGSANSAKQIKSACALKHRQWNSAL